VLDLIVGAVKPEIIDLAGAVFLSLRNHVLDHGFAFGIFKILGIGAGQSRIGAGCQVLAIHIEDEDIQVAMHE